MTKDQEIEDLKTQISGLKIRIRRIETFLRCIPNSEEYIPDNDSDDYLLEEAKRLVVKYDKASASLLQRRLGTGYAKAAWLLDKLEEADIVGTAEGSKPRDVLIPKDKSKKKKQKADEL